MHYVSFAGFRHGHIYQLYDQVNAYPGAELRGCFEENEEARESAKNGRGIDFNYSSFDEILNDDKTDIVAIGDYYGARGSLAIKALRAGKHVIADKPVCITLEELDEIEKLVKENNLKFGCMLSLRYSKYTAVAKKVIKEHIGDIHAVSFMGEHSLSYGSRPMWYFEKGKHGGTINDLAVHGVDLTEYLSGKRLANIEAARTWNAFAKEEPDFKDCAQFMVTMDGGCGVIADVSYAAPSKATFDIPYYWQFLIWGEGGMIKFAENGQPLEAYIDGRNSAEYIYGEDSPRNHIIDFCDEIDGKEEDLVCSTPQVLASSRDTLKIQAYADGAEK